MNQLEGKPLQPLASGIVLIAGVKASNFDEEIKTHPRVVLWDSQNEHWHSKNLPDNTRVVFVTRFIAHAPFHNIMSEARKRQITIFNPEGTGMIAKQVRELLGIAKEPMTLSEFLKEPSEKKEKEKIHGKLQLLHQFIDFSKSNMENGRVLYAKAKEIGIQTTELSLSVMVQHRRKKMSGTAVPKSIRPKMDVSVEILDNMVKELQAMRDFIIDTTNENAILREKLAKFKKVFEEV